MRKELVHRCLEFGLENLHANWEAAEVEHVHITTSQRDTMSDLFESVMCPERRQTMELKQKLKEKCLH